MISSPEAKSPALPLVLHLTHGSTVFLFLHGFISSMCSSLTKHLTWFHYSQQSSPSHNTVYPSPPPTPTIYISISMDMFNHARQIEVGVLLL
jgi:hypothetical protein